MKRLDIKPGSIVIYKEYGLLKRLWYKLLGKSSPFNKWALYFRGCTMFVDITNVNLKEKNRFIILEPVKQYSKKEEQTLKSKVIEYIVKHDGLMVFGDESLYMINLVRSNTLCSPFTIESLLKNKYYKVVYDSKEKSF